MKTYEWNAEKNELLIRERGISFEEIVARIDDGGIIAVTQHPNHKKYPNQRLIMVNIDGYVYTIPAVPTEAGWFLKTIIPSRKATRDFLGGCYE